MSDEEFGAITPAQFDALLKRKKVSDLKAFLRAGMIAANIINFSMGPPKEPVNPRDFIPEYLLEESDRKKKDFDLRELSPEAQKMYIIDMFSKRRMGR